MLFPISKSLSIHLLLWPMVLCCALRVQAEPVDTLLPEVRPLPLPSSRPLAKGPLYFVDAEKGDDASAGSKEKPWRSINHALTQLQPGDTLYLRGGTYFENVRISVSGTAEKPITISSYPGELATINGGWREFIETPAKAWQPATGGTADEYISTQSYPNIRDVVGHLAPSRIGLQTYAHLQDLRSQMELWDQAKGEDVPPLYVGPGLYYDDSTGRIHVRLAHTHLMGIANYEGETDPRRLPLVIAPFRSIPLHLDGATHLHVQDVFVRGGGYDTVVVDDGEDVGFDGVVVRCGTYGMRVANTQGLRFLHSALNGNNPPWGFRNENSLHSREGSGLRDITRLTCHALWVADTGREFSVYAFPLNDDWEIAYSDFTDSHDGLYLGGVGTHFHHNRLDNCHDDGIYISPIYPNARGDIYIYQNIFSRCLTTLAFGGSETKTDDKLYIYRNIFDLRGPTNYGRPSTEHPQGNRDMSNVFGDHGSPPWATMNIYQNTFVMKNARDAMMSLGGSGRIEYPRHIFNNLFLHLERLPAYKGMDGAVNQWEDGNAYWAVQLHQAPAGFFDKYRATPAFIASKQALPEGSTAHSVVADPLLQDDYRPRPDSPLVDSGVPIPAEWPDPLREQDKGKPDIGALPLGVGALQVGSQADKNTP